MNKILLAIPVLIILTAVVIIAYDFFNKENQTRQQCLEALATTYCLTLQQTVNRIETDSISGKVTFTCAKNLLAQPDKYELSTNSTRTCNK